MRRAAPGRAGQGFSLVEMMMTMLIMSLVMVIVVGGASVAQKLFRNTMAKADAQMVLSQIERYLRDDLSFTDACMIEEAIDYDDNGNLIQYDSDGDPVEWTVTEYHKNGFWYKLQNGVNPVSAPRRNILYKTFSAVGEAQSGGADDEFDSGSQILYEPLSASNSRRLEDIAVQVPEITYIPAQDCFRVANLRVQRDGTTIAGAENDSEEYLVIRALNKVKMENE
ncbi:MAG: prepilin-type N-terminal cleavage/methylation domain-containing protein [Oscillibacter sp.]|nr:prepilin-type N-terminal cleavage/methylation domain-containing protein [Oscillibacter sp.]